MPYKDPAQRRAAQQRYRLRNRDKCRAYGSAYAKTHSDKINARRKRWRQTEAGKTSDRATALKQRDRRNARRRTKRALYPGSTFPSDKRWKEANRDRLNALRRAQHAVNPLLRREEAKRQRLHHPERLAARFRRWYLANRDQHLPRQRRYRQANPHVPRLSATRRMARKHGLPDTFTHDERAFMLEYWHHACAVCGNQDGFFWTLADDHWIPLASSTCPGTIATNMIPLCDGQGGCNTSKQARDAHEWLFSCYAATKAKRILKAVDTYFALVRTRQAAVAD